MVSLKVYNMQGTEVEILVSQVMQAGTHEAKFNGSNLPDGVYYYRLLSGDISLVKKLMVSRGNVSAR
jgi:hypothetical protein